MLFVVVVIIVLQYNKRIGAFHRGRFVKFRHDMYNISDLRNVTQHVIKLSSIRLLQLQMTCVIDTRFATPIQDMLMIYCLKQKK